MRICLFLLFGFHMVSCQKQINITIMVPGIKAFKELVEEARPLEEGETPSDYYSDETSNSTDWTSYYAVANELFSAELSHKNFTCVDYETGIPDVGCLQENYYFLYPWSYVFAKPALEVALEAIEKTKGLLEGFDISLQYWDSGNSQGKTSSRLAQIAVVDSMIHDHMTALIGPMNDYAMSRVLSFTAHWKKLTITPVSISAWFRKEEKQKELSTLVRSGPVGGLVGDCVSAVMKFYNWTTVAIQVFEDNFAERYHYFTVEGIYTSVIRDNPSHKMEQLRLSEYVEGNSDNNYTYDVIMKNIKNQARVIIISAKELTIRELMIQAHKYGFGEAYVYIIIDVDNKLGPRPWESIDENGAITVDKKIRLMMENVLIITLQKNESPKMTEFVKNVREKVKETVYGVPEDATFSRKVAEDVIKLEQSKTGDEDYFLNNLYPAYLHDSLWMLAHILNSSVNDNTPSKMYDNDGPFASSFGTFSPHDPFPDGTYLMNNYVRKKEFEGVTGKMLFNENGDRLFNFSILDLDPKRDMFRVVGEFDSAGKHYYEHADIHWSGGSAPPDVPRCGFDDSKCRKTHLTLVEGIVIFVVAIAIVVIIIAVLVFRRHQIQKELESQLWRVYWHDITWPISDNDVLGGNLNSDLGLSPPPVENNPSLGEVMSYLVPSLSPALAVKRAHKRRRKWSSNSKKNERILTNERKTSAGSLISNKPWGGLTTIGLYKDKTVVLKLTNRRKIELSRNLLMEMKHMRDITYEHLTRFEGACLEWPHICVLNEYCGKGSLKEILLNEEITMDWMFRVSLMNDLVKGMCFLHGSAFNCHGNLKSTNCVVDSRFVLKITDYGLHCFKSIMPAEESERDFEKKLWTAPELLRGDEASSGTQKGDVYSFGIILQEIALRKGPFYVEGTPLTCKETIAKVRYGFRPYYRPTIHYETLSEDICNLMQKCWHEDPSERPDFNLTKKIIEKFNSKFAMDQTGLHLNNLRIVFPADCKDNPGNLVENLLHRMEQYAINLEGLVEERTAAYLEEKQKADDLLYQMLPVPVVDRLKRGDSVPAEAFESVTICFTDIVGFTSLSAASSPMEIVSLLNDLYTCFDAIIDNFDVYKVETIGDAYMLVSGLPVRNGISHACQIARTALALLKAVRNFQIRHRPDDQLQLRIGIHSGPCCAGVVGLKMPRYCLFGDTVNTASRMESNGVALAIHVSEPTKQLLDTYQSFKLQLRGNVEMKGKGSLTTYWLLDEIKTDMESNTDTERSLSSIVSMENNVTST